MYIYNVTVKVENHRVNEWIEWMKTIHIPEVLATGNFIESRLCRLLDDGDIEGETFAVQYTCKTIEDFTVYKLNSATKLQEDARVRFGNDFVAFRTFMEIL